MALSTKLPNMPEITTLTLSVTDAATLAAQGYVTTQVDGVCLIACNLRPANAKPSGSGKTVTLVTTGGMKTAPQNHPDGGALYVNLTLSKENPNKVLDMARVEMAKASELVAKAEAEAKAKGVK